MSLYMPLWSNEELDQCNFALGLPSYSREYIAKWGGVYLDEMRAELMEEALTDIWKHHLKDTLLSLLIIHIKFQQICRLRCWTTRWSAFLLMPKCIISGVPPGLSKYHGLPHTVSMNLSTFPFLIRFPSAFLLFTNGRGLLYIIICFFSGVILPPCCPDPPPMAIL